MQRILRLFLLGFGGSILLGVGGVGGALALENQDAFCATCHTEPEVTFYQRSIQEKKVDLAAYHTAERTRCIDCHSGSGAWGRLIGLQQGAHDLAAFVSGTYRHPAITTNPIGDDTCLQCHPQTLVRPPGASRSGTGHYHYFLPQWQGEDSHAARCVNCHTGHEPGIDRLKFMQQGKVGEKCDECHTALSGKVK
ncbi:MAG: NapC/NirT family cytochrome c [Chloroflexi bacterium]|nr:NapC/NirT family cytochrome c [Chloroflexota bacterium]